VTEHWFYHLQQSPLEQILPEILEKTYAKGWRTLVKVGPLRGEAVGEMQRLDEFLWTYRQDAFLPHGRDDEPLADQQPICLSTDALSPANADVVVLIAGAEMDDVSKTVRCITMLDGADDNDRKIARTRWKAAKDAGVKTAYWRQDDHGKWIKPDL
jgi:DNA polymerase-3 subunit chi